MTVWLCFLSIQFSNYKLYQSQAFHFTLPESSIWSLLLQFKYLAVW